MRTALDTNVISALWSQEVTAQRIVSSLGEAQRVGGLVICAPVYVELSAHPKVTMSFVDEFLRNTSIVVDFVLDERVWRKAAEVFSDYARRRRKAGGQKRLLVDFIIGAHATLHADRLMTLDQGRYEKTFPTLKLLN
jgi:hypothetical protein